MSQVTYLVKINVDSAAWATEYGHADIFDAALDAAQHVTSAEYAQAMIDAVKALGASGLYQVDAAVIDTTTDDVPFTPLENPPVNR
jgi:hypothetical protein